MLFIENMYYYNHYYNDNKECLADYCGKKKSKGLDNSPPSFLCFSPLSVSPESNDHQTLLTGDPGGDRCRGCPSFAHFRGKCG